MLKQVIIDLFRSCINADDKQVEKWENGDVWPEMDELMSEMFKIRARKIKKGSRVKDLHSTKGIA